MKTAGLLLFIFLLSTKLNAQRINTIQRDTIPFDLTKDNYSNYQNKESYHIASYTINHSPLSGKLRNAICIFDNKILSLDSIETKKLIRDSSLVLHNVIQDKKSKSGVNYILFFEKKRALPKSYL